MWPALVIAMTMFVFLGALIPASTNHTSAYATPLDPFQPHVPQAAAQLAEATPTTLYLPLLSAPLAVLVPGSEWRSPFGVQPIVSLAHANTIGKLVDLHSAWVRLGDRISWRKLQPHEGDPFHWELLADFEQELRALKQAGVTPVVNINDSPRWATVLPTSCGAIRPDKLAAFAEFVRALVARYRTEEFNVHDWELGNEPDVDPSLVGSDNQWGCWGNIKDPFYGGREYGEMLKVVGPAIKAEDPAAQVWTGGLLLDRPDNTNPKVGRPELFLQGILEAGAAPYFDVVAYHIYAYYREPLVDYDTVDAWVWKSWGGRMVGKARFLKHIMAAYGVDKPVIANEIGLLWCPTSANCPAPGAVFYDAQANFVVRSLVRGIGAGVHGFFWYPLEWPGFRYSALLDQNGNPKPVYTTYQQLAIQLAEATYLGPVDYGAGIEAYTFTKGAERVQVIWTVDVTTNTISIQPSQFIQASARDGEPIVPIDDGLNSRLTVGFEPIYVVLRREQP
jgi:hypothetical protein